MTSPDKRTPLYEVQKQRGGRFVSFAGWEMPVQFSGTIAEHQAVRTAVGLFDVSHMGEVILDGPDALAAVQFLVTNDIAKLKDGKAAYAFMCVEAGGIVDDLIVYREAADRFFLCVNAGRKDADVAHIKSVLAKFRCRVRDLSAEYVQLALQGPNALGLLSKLTSADLVRLPSFAFVDDVVAGIKARIARTGYTGEDGVEIYCESARGEELWRALESVGEKFGLVPCGLGARDTLRLEMKYPLYGSDIDQHNPLEAGLGWAVKLGKDDFLGKKSLAEIAARGPARRWVGLKTQSRNIARHGHVIQCSGEVVGVVTSGTFSPSLREPIATGYVPAKLAALGAAVQIVIRDQPIPAVVVETPFYRREAKMSVPSDRKYTKDHEWLLADGDLALVGITEHAEKQLGDVVFVDLPAVGTPVAQGAAFGTVESVKAVSDLFAPISGEVVAVNEQLLQQPELVNQDPYHAAWMIKVKPATSAGDAALVSASDYEAWLATLAK